MTTPPTHLPRRVRGFTLIEMLIVLTIAGILSGVAFPSLAAVVDSIRMRSIANEFLSSMHLARAEAIKRNGRVALCKSMDGNVCAATGDWGQGWIVFHDADNDGAAEIGEQVIQRVQALPAGFRLSGNHLLSRYISFSPTGTTRTVGGAFQAGTVTLCKASASSSEGREVVLNNVGRMRVNKIKVADCA
ncbi:GspH/FimT family pseudopilin [Caenimonas soli]|uniref:GspH/FimT family pseudopilin n=1 Tax=Caenimonas soli TaxID=2735555 RepID=UPI0015556A81|nr:Tfp pilus assembly protein FimT/FimU [Caenimonas soli]NPC56710.1 prepilin-type N-terminal cleavage/methylation domain-containing protein [Caenimonas soli]